MGLQELAFGRQSTVDQCLILQQCIEHTDKCALMVIPSEAELLVVIHCGDQFHHRRPPEPLLPRLTPPILPVCLQVSYYIQIASYFRNKQFELIVFFSRVSAVNIDAANCLKIDDLTYNVSCYSCYSRSTF